MEVSELVRLSRGAKTIDRTEAQLRRDIISGKVKGQKLGRDWFLPTDEVKRLSELYPVTPVAV